MGCNKTDDDDHDEDYNPTINIIAPSEGAMTIVGQEVTIEAEIDREDNKTIHNVTVVIEDADGNIVETLIDNEHVHASGHHHIAETFTPTSHGQYLLKVITTDHGDASKKVEAERSFTAMDATYDATIDIQEPAENTIINVNDDLPIKVVVTHDQGGTIHHVRIQVLDDAGGVVATLDDGHKHVEGSYIYESTDDFTATTAGTFKITAMTMNMDMSIMHMEERAFTVQ